MDNRQLLNRLAQGVRRSLLCARQAARQRQQCVGVVEVVVIDEVTARGGELPHALLDDCEDIAASARTGPDHGPDGLLMLQIEDAPVNRAASVREARSPFGAGLTRKTGAARVCRWPRRDFLECSKLAHAACLEHKPFQGNSRSRL